MSALPKAIQREVEQAEAAQAVLQQQSQQAANEVVTDTSQLSVDEQGAQPQNTQPQVTQPSDDWQQKYRSLQGMFAQKTGELQAQNKAYESQLAQMQRQIESLASTKRQDEVREKTAADPSDVEAFGADLVGMVQRYAERVFRAMSEQFASALVNLNERVTVIEQNLQGVSSKTDATLEQQFYATLANLVPDWQKINQDQRWLAWLGEADPVYGTSRQVALDSAHKDLDVQRVAHIFKAFKQSLPKQQSNSLESQVAPNSAASSVPNAGGVKQVLSAKFVEKFYSDVAKGKYAGREAEAQRIESEINLAASEGRIR